MNKKFSEGSRRLGGRLFVLMVVSSLNLIPGSVRREFKMEELKGKQITIWLDAGALRRASLH